MNPLPVRAINTSALLPSAIRLRTASRLLELDWPDGTARAWTHSLLRECCRCAECEASRRQGMPVTVVADVSIIDVVSYGSNALRFTFSDGHDRGIYPYAYLLQLPVSCANAAA